MCNVAQLVIEKTEKSQNFISLQNSQTQVLSQQISEHHLILSFVNLNAILKL